MEQLQQLLSATENSKIITGNAFKRVVEDLIRLRKKAEEIASANEKEYSYHLQEIRELI